MNPMLAMACMPTSSLVSSDIDGVSDDALCLGNAVLGALFGGLALARTIKLAKRRFNRVRFHECELRVYMSKRGFVLNNKVFKSRNNHCEVF